MTTPGGGLAPLDQTGCGETLVLVHGGWSDRNNWLTVCGGGPGLRIGETMVLTELIWTPTAAA